MAEPLKPSRSASIEPIVALIETLRSENGCPWDKKQTPKTMARYLVEEIYELVDAIISNNPAAVCEEAGDVLFQLLFVVNLFRESGDFCLKDVVEKNVEKMIRRHPHVFDDITITTSEKVSENWDRIKRKEISGAEFRPVLSSIPQRMPALLRASMVSERAAKTGFDWEDIYGVMAKTMEEWEEFSMEVHDPDYDAGGDRAAMEFGDLLFTMVNVARFARIHPETALIQSIQKFEKRFGYMEKKALEAGREIGNLDLREMNDLWAEAKDKVG